MSIPIPAETPDPNIDSPVIPPTEPEPVPEARPARHPTTASGRTAEHDAAGDCEAADHDNLRGVIFLDQPHDPRHHAENRQRQQRTEHRRRLPPQPGRHADGGGHP